MKKFSPEERRGVVAVVTIALILCLLGIGLNYCDPFEEGRNIEVTTKVASDSIGSESSVNSNYSKPDKSRSSNSKKKEGSGRRRKRLCARKIR